MGRFGGQDYLAPRWRRAAPAAQEQDERKLQTAPKETIVAGGNGKRESGLPGLLPKPELQVRSKILGQIL